MNKKIFFSSGGTGGHMFPTISTMNFFSNKGYEVFLATDIRGYNYLDEEKKRSSFILKTDTPFNKNIILKITSYIKIFFSILNACLILKKNKPNLIFGMGGYVSFPVCLASKLFKIPLVLYESNLVLGRANRYLLPLSIKILTVNDSLTNFPNKHNNKICNIGNILREDILKYSPSENNLKKTFNILILGGSQGAEIFAKVIPDVIKKISEKGYKIKIFQQCKKEQKNDLINFYKKNNIENNIFNFSEKILNYLSDSDLAITRCGASTLAELEYTEVPFIAIPYPFALDNHQYLNAKFYEKKGCCWTLEQSKFNSNNLLNLIFEILNNKKKLYQIRENMHKNTSKHTFTKVEKIVQEII